MITFGEPEGGGILEEVDFNYTIQIPRAGTTVSIENIEIEKMKWECCSYYVIATLTLDESVNTYNSAYVELEI
ncbi:hypothetical protein [Marinoscillum sp. MHG1-6]|uniref:hypothetical protein n=1 Tax=Marinoscillum sp. MHG1-6 TaxID=2959627 RepID=UPI0021570F4A|nr:hypothetical protein [Marinoscillum sp. MHG1-6]